MPSSLITVSGDVAITGGTYVAGASLITVSGDAAITGGTYVAGSSTLTLDGATKTLRSNQELYNLIIKGTITQDTEPLDINQDHHTHRKL